MLNLEEYGFKVEARMPSFEDIKISDDVVMDKMKSIVEAAYKNATGLKPDLEPSENDDAKWFAVSAEKYTHWMFTLVIHMHVAESYNSVVPHWQVMARVQAKGKDIHFFKETQSERIDFSMNSLNTRGLVEAKKVVQKLAEQTIFKRDEIEQELKAAEASSLPGSSASIKKCLRAFNTFIRRAKR